MDDLIKRADVLNLLKKLAADHFEFSTRYEHYLEIGVEIEDGIKALPTTQPEIIRCHECAKRRTLDCPMGITVFDAPPSDGYCYKADRRR